MWAVYRKDVEAFFHSLFGYLYVAFWLLIVGIYFAVYNLISGYVDFGYVLGSTRLLLVVMVPMLAMTTWGKERRQRTDRLLFTASVSRKALVLGKFGAMFTVFSLPVLVTAPYPLVLARYGQVPLMQSYGCIMAYLCLGAACCAIGLFLSSLCDGTAMAACATLAVLLFLYLADALRGFAAGTATRAFLSSVLLVLGAAAAVGKVLKNRAAGLLTLAGGTAAAGLVCTVWPQTAVMQMERLLHVLALFDRYMGFTQGVFDFSTIVWFLSLAAFFVFLTVLRFENWGLI